MRRKLLGKHLNKRELLSPRLLIKYHDKRPPDKSTKKKLIEAASVACSVMLRTVFAIDKVVLFYRDESDVMTQVLDSHFCFKNLSTLLSTKDAKKKMVNAKARRKQLSTIRRNMLSISFHLNTGMYLLDTDAGHRTIVGDNEIDTMNKLWSDQEYVLDSGGYGIPDASDPTGWQTRSKTNAAGKRVLGQNIEAYAQAGSSGPVHVSFELAKTYSALQFARLIVHEASHSFCGTSDVKYAWESDYYSQRQEDMINNADSYAFAAVSIAANTLHDKDSLKGAAYS